ncbi:MFS transporter [Actinomadura madurae]|uniref:MFS transporter n=2 Tax=Actinomadura madurae TaxID=1993 RepID=UPI0020D25E73|nr:MFS transporter [Actinomadura madurae]MCP9950235.1 MFS transporter [Actinomadura madurae]MCP9967010.1 MFS transporter [Actinomadura madurae]MCP9979475.1 MFS transporter [Actinomadura madurae]MCQ0008995.1 MFS transporter [Actinomadura madurae]
MSQGTTARDRQARSAAYTAFAVQGLCFASLVTQVPQMQKAHHLSDATLSLVLLMVPLIAGVGSVASGALFQRFGSGPVLRVSQPAVAVTIALIGLTGDNDVALYVAVAAFGLFVGAVDASMNAQAIAVERRYGVSLITGFYAVWSVAGILGGLWASLTNKLDLSLFTGFAIAAAVGVAAALATGSRLYRRAEEGDGPTAAELKAAGRRVPWRPILVVGAAMAVAYLADSAISSYGAKYLDDELSASDWVAPLGYVAYQITMVVSRAVADLAVRRSGAVQVVRIGGLVGIVGMFGVVAAPNAAFAIAAFALAGLGLSVIAPVSFSAAGRVDPTGLGVAVARVNIFNYVGFVLGAAVVGAIAPLSADHGLRLAFIVPSALILVVFVTAKGFDPEPVGGARPDAPAMERPVA